MKYCLFRRNGLDWLFGLVCLGVCLWIFIPAGVRADSTPSILWEKFFFPNGGGANSVAVGPDNNPVITAPYCSLMITCNDILTIQFDGATGAQLSNTTFGLAGSDDGAGGVAVGPDGHPVVTGYSFGGGVFRTIKYDKATWGELWNVISSPTGRGATAVAVGSDCNPVVTGADFRTIKYDWVTGAELWDIETGGAFSFGVAVAPDGSVVVTGRLGPNGGGWRTIKYTSSVSLSRCTPDIAVTKTATAAVHVGDSISVTAHVTNTGDTPLTVTVTDDKAGTLSGPTTLAARAAADYTGSYTAPAAGNTTTNTVTASGVDSLGGVTATASFTTTILNDPPMVGMLSSVPAAVGGSVLIPTGTSVAFSAPWTDVNLLDTHTAVCNIVDVFGTTPSSAVSGTAPESGSGTASCSVIFAREGGSRQRMGRASRWTGVGVASERGRR